MRILFVTPHYKPYLGGIERVIEKLGQEFLKRSEVEAVGTLTTHWAFPRRYMQGLPSCEVIGDGMEVFRVSSWPKKAPPLYQVPLVWFSPLEIKRVINQFRPDVIQLMSDRWFWGNFWAWVFSKEAQVAFSLSFHELGWGQGAKLPAWLAKQFLRSINAFLTRVVDWVQVITQHEKKLVQQAYWTPVDKMHIIPWGINVSRIRSWKEASYQPKGEIEILCVGRLSKHKGQVWLLEVFAEVQSLITKKVRLIFVGSDEGVEKDLKIKIHDLGLEGRVEILGEVSDDKLGQLYQSADIFALFPEYEAFGLVFLEAMAHGVPVLTHMVGAIEEVLKDQAMLVEPYNKTQAKAALAKLVQAGEFRVQLGKQGQRYVEENFSWKKTAESFLRIYGKYE